MKPTPSKILSDLIALGETQESIAKALGVSQPTVSRILSEAKKKVDIDLYEKALKMLTSKKKSKRRRGKP